MLPIPNLEKSVATKSIDNYFYFIHLRSVLNLYLKEKGLAAELLNCTSSMNTSFDVQKMLSRFCLKNAECYHNCLGSQTLPFPKAFQ